MKKYMVGRIEIITNDLEKIITGINDETGERERGRNEGRE